MRLTFYTDYSLRVLMYLALQGESLSTIQEIATRYAISRNHLTKVVHDLQRRGYIETLRGKGGGLRLRRPAETISVGALVRETETDMDVVECFGPRNACVITPHCTLKNVLGQALGAFLSVLDRYTLADLLDDRQGLRRSLSLP